MQVTFFVHFSDIWRLIINDSILHMLQDGTSDIEVDTWPLKGWSHSWEILVKYFNTFLQVTFSYFHVPELSWIMNLEKFWDAFYA